jgi:hypothetical protein
MSRYIAALLALLLVIGYTTDEALAQQTLDPPAITDVDVASVLATLRRVEAEQKAEAATWATRRNLPLALAQSGGGRVQIVGMEAGRPVYLTSLNRAAAERTHTATLHPGHALGFNLTGKGLDIGIWDGGLPLRTHQEFGGRIYAGDHVDDENHATHVAGTLIASGVRPEAQGMAYEASLRAYDWNDDATEMTTEAARGVLVSNHSYGLIAGWHYGNLEDNGDQWYWLGDPSVSETEDYTFGFYNVEAAQFDRVVYSHPTFLPVVAAGNDRNDDGPSSGSYRTLTRQGTWQTKTITSDRRDPDGGPEGYDSISGASLAKNVLTVGSVRFSQNQASVSSFSSFGPTDDGRIKPDLVGSGEQIFSTLASGIAAYGHSSGTSMASPNVAGSLVLLQEHYLNLTGQTMRAATLKGLALHTAQDAGAAGPDYQYGWGVLDAEAAARQINESLANTLALQEVVLSHVATFTQPATVREAGPLRVSISWTDLPSSRLPIRGASTLNNRTPHLQNDLDLRVINDETGETYLPFTLNPEQPSATAVPGDNVVDPFEQVFVARVPAGSYTIVVTHKGTLVAEDPQPFSLLVTGAEGAIRPVAVGHFDADPSLEEVVLTWQTPFERGDGTFVMRRAPLTVYPDGHREAGAFVEVGTQETLGISEQKQTYTFTDPHVASGRYLYRIFFESSSGPYLAAETETLVPAPENYALLSNYPNPFNDRTTLVLDLPEQQTLTVEVYDILGRRLAQVYSGTLPAGRHEMPVDANGWAPGVYFARFITPEAVRSHRMVVTR